MKNSKSFLLILIITVLAFAASACTLGTGGGSSNVLVTPSFKGQRVSATIESIDGDQVEFSVMYSYISSMPSGSGNIAISIATITGATNVSFNTVQTFDYSSNIYFGTGELSGGSVVIGNITGITASSITATVAHELLEGFAVGDTVYVTFDENGDVTNLEKREVSADKDKEDINDKEDKEDKNDKDDSYTSAKTTVTTEFIKEADKKD